MTADTLLFEGARRTGLIWLGRKKRNDKEEVQIERGALNQENDLPIDEGCARNAGVEVWRCQDVRMW